jgi:hypothetical protein
VTVRDGTTKGVKTMKQTIDKHEFEQAFRRADRYDNFGYAGLAALFDYLEEYESDTGEEIDLDVIALCCDYSLHDSAAACAAEMSSWDKPEREEGEECDDYNERINKDALEYLNDRTTVVLVDDENGPVIVRSF